MPRRRANVLLVLISILLLIVVGVVVVVYLGTRAKTAPPEAVAEFVAGAQCERQAEDAQAQPVLRQQSRDCAIEHYRAAIGLFPSDWTYHYRLGEMLVQAGRPEYRADALQAYFEALRLKPDEPGPYEGIRALNETVQRETVVIEDRYVIFDDNFRGSYMALPEGSPPFVTVTDTLANVRVGTRALRYEWSKGGQEWSSLILGIDSNLGDLTRAQAASLTGIQISRDDYALHFFIRSGSGDEYLTIKFQDQNMLIRESLGNQVVNGVVATTRWEEHCLPLNTFYVDGWIQSKYGQAVNLAFDWANVKQVNLDAPYFATQGSVYLDQIEIIRTADCPSSSQTG
jgi:hypothetical protein